MLFINSGKMQRIEQIANIIFQNMIAELATVDIFDEDFQNFAGGEINSGIINIYIF